MTAKLHILESARKPPAVTPRALRKMLVDEADWAEMLVIGYDVDGCVCQRSTPMTNAEALMLVEQFKARLLGQRSADEVQGI